MVKWRWGGLVWGWGGGVGVNLCGVVGWGVDLCGGGGGSVWGIGAISPTHAKCDQINVKQLNQAVQLYEVKGIHDMWLIEMTG